MNKILFIALLFLLSTTYAQNKGGHFNVSISKIEGDLNKDGINDVVIVTQDTLNEILPYKLEVFFAQPNGKLKLIVSTIKAIEPASIGYGNEFDDVSIEKGVLIIDFQLLRGHYTHRFRYQNGNFELIGYTEVGLSAGKVYTTDFNLSTGMRNEKVENIGTDKVLSNKIRKVLIRPLPKLQDFVPATRIIVGHWKIKSNS